jgi:hypothetical protein
MKAQVPANDQKLIPQHKRAAMGLPVNKPVPTKQPKTPA